jgi:ABC-type transport system involved in resistance to organic solvents, periplasmic component
MKVGKINLFKPPTYIISAYFASANGISTGTNVEMAGIKVGTVKKIKLENGQARVYMEINSKYKIYPDYTASIRSMSLLGESYISISPANTIQALSSKPVPENEIIKSYKSPENMSSLILKFAKTADNLDAVTKSLKKSIGTKTGEHKIKAILANIAELSDNLNRLVYLNQKNFNVIMTNFAGFSRNINGLTVENDRALTKTIHNFRAISDIIGSSPVVGSSKRTVSGSNIIALATATLFLIPPDNSAGIFDSIPLKPTSFKPDITFFIISPSDNFRCCLKGNATFSKILIESNNAPS